MTAAEVAEALAEVQATRLEHLGRQAGIYWTATELMSADFPPPRWAVPGLVAEGLNLLVGSPKLGKSWLCLGLAVSIAAGGRALGKVQVDRGEVLYAALEDTPRRLQDRLASVLHGEPPPEGLHIVTSLPRLPEAAGVLDEWLTEHPAARLVIIDVLRKVRPLGEGTKSMYDADYDALGSLKALADRHGVSFLLVHHSRKQVDDGDVFNEVSGSTGLTGAADAVLYAKRARNTSEAILHVTGRDVTEREYGMTWDAETCSWLLSDEPAMLATMGSTRRKILEHIAAHEGDSPAQVSQALSLKADSVRQTMRRMVDDDQLGTDGEGRYFLPKSLSHLSPLSLLPGDSDTCDSSDTPLEGVS